MPEKVYRRRLGSLQRNFAEHEKVLIVAVKQNRIDENHKWLRLIIKVIRLLASYGIILSIVLPLLLGILLSTLVR